LVESGITVTPVPIEPPEMVRVPALRPIGFVCVPVQV
jgi:hypothetical protein